MSETKAEELIARLRVRRLEIVSAAEARRRIDEWQAEREAEAAHARALLQRHIQETARRVDRAAHAAGTTTGATRAPAPPGRKIEASPVSPEYLNWILGGQPDFFERYVQMEVNGVK